MKLSRTMVSVLRAMADGWELASTWSTGVWLQQGGAGLGGDSRMVSRGTLSALSTRGLVRSVTRFPESPTRYTLSEAGLLELKKLERADA